MQKTIFQGTSTPQGCVVTVDGAVLDPRLDLVNHSPTGFAWGYHGSGPAQLALAILARLYDAPTAERYHQLFKAHVIAALPDGNWRLTGSDVEHVMAQLRAEAVDAGQV